MCVTPCNLPDGVQISCRKCWQCKERKIDDWAGRCIAESRTCKNSFMITMTYGRDGEGMSDHMNACVLTYSDVQKLWKRLRKDGYKFKYIVAGEYGSKNLRAHWHAIIFLEGNLPKIKLDGKIQQWDYWPHGHVVAETVHINSARYLCKYILKDENDEFSQSHFSMSKKPPIGTNYFEQLAELQVRSGLAPQSPEYNFSDIRTKNGKSKQFFMSKTVRRDYIRHYIKTWITRRKDHIPSSEFIEEFQDSEQSDYMEMLRFKEKVNLAIERNKEHDQKKIQIFEYWFKLQWEDNFGEIKTHFANDPQGFVFETREGRYVHKEELDQFYKRTDRYALDNLQIPHDTFRRAGKLGKLSG